MHYYSHLINHFFISDLTVFGIRFTSTADKQAEGMYKAAALFRIFHDAQIESRFKEPLGALFSGQEKILFRFSQIT